MRATIYVFRQFTHSPRNATAGSVFTARLAGSNDATTAVATTTNATPINTAGSSRRLIHQHRRNELRAPERNRSPDHDANRRHRHTQPDDLPRHSVPRRPERDLHPDLPRPLPHAVTHNAENPDRREREREQLKHREQRRVESIRPIISLHCRCVLEQVHVHERKLRRRPLHRIPNGLEPRARLFAIDPREILSQMRARILRERNVRERHRILEDALATHVLHDAEDLGARQLVVVAGSDAQTYGIRARPTAARGSRR